MDSLTLSYFKDENRPISVEYTNRTELAILCSAFRIPEALLYIDRDEGVFGIAGYDNRHNGASITFVEFMKIADSRIPIDISPDDNVIN
jgi:hypothetical protein